MASISSREMGEAEEIAPDFFESYDIPENVPDTNLTPLNIEFDKYNLTRYAVVGYSN